MDQTEFSIVRALAMASMGNPNSAIINHISRLIKLFESKGELEKAQSLRLLLEVDRDAQPVKVILSKT